MTLENLGVDRGRERSPQCFKFEREILPQNDEKYFPQFMREIMNEQVWEAIEFLEVSFLIDQRYSSIHSKEVIFPKVNNEARNQYYGL